MYKRIAVAIDGTPNALGAVREAAELAKIHQSDSVALVTVVSERAYTKANREAIEAQGANETKIVSSAMELLDKATIKNELVMLHGAAVAEIAQYVDGAGVELLVVGDGYLKKIHKSSGNGSTTKKISREVNCPVLIVK